MNEIREVTAEDLHAAADIVGEMGDDESRIGEWGLPASELVAFIEGSHWSETRTGGPAYDMDPLALAIGISIGVIARSLDGDHAPSREH